MVDFTNFSVFFLSIFIFLVDWFFVMKKRSKIE